MKYILQFFFRMLKSIFYVNVMNVKNTLIMPVNMLKNYYVEFYSLFGQLFQKEEYKLYKHTDAITLPSGSFTSRFRTISSGRKCFEHTT